MKIPNYWVIDLDDESDRKGVWDGLGDSLPTPSSDELPDGNGATDRVKESTETAQASVGEPGKVAFGVGLIALIAGLLARGDD